MLVRFRRRHRRLLVSLLESHRVTGKAHPCSAHIASLGSIREPMDVAGRVAFWQALHERLSRLANRVGPEQQAVIMGKVHERIPMVTPEEQRRLQLGNAQGDERFWGLMQELNTSEAEAHEMVAAKFTAAAKALRANAASSSERLTTARTRLAKLDAREVVAGGLGRQPSIDKLFRAAGMSPSEIQHCRDVAALAEVGLFDHYSEEVGRHSHGAIAKRREQRLARELLSAAELARAAGVDLAEVLKRPERKNH
jgi:hypothetical protein